MNTDLHRFFYSLSFIRVRSPCVSVLPRICADIRRLRPLKNSKNC